MNTVTESLKMTILAMCNDLTIKLWNAAKYLLVAGEGYWD
jgi:hypothetical protein